MYPFARGGLFQLEVLRDGAVAFILRDIVVVRVCTAADVQIQSASCIFEGIHRAFNKSHGQRISIADRKQRLCRRGLAVLCRMYTRLVRDGRFCRPSRALQLRLCSLVVGILFGNGNDAGAEFTAVIYNCTGKRHPAHHRPNL